MFRLADRLQIVLPWRRRARLAPFGHRSLKTLPVADIDLDSGCHCTRCAGHEYASAFELRRYARRAAGSSVARRGRPAIALLDLRAFSRFGDYEKAVSQASGGNDTRMVKKARRLGFVVRQVATDSYAKSYAEVRESKSSRSQGVVLYAKFKSSAALVDSQAPFRPPSCSRSWTLDWSVFGPATDGVRLVAFAQLRRTGNYAELTQLMGHGDYLKQGVVKLLVFEILEWLLQSGDSLADGIRFLHYGATESGSDATTQWRRYMQFKPFLPRLAHHVQRAIPRDFKSLQYLRLHPDVAASGMDPRLHYALFGVHAGYDYKPFVRSRDGSMSAS